jgi:hypothetical protein
VDSLRSPIFAFKALGYRYKDIANATGRYSDEPPTGSWGEYLYILVSTPEWLGET